MLQASPIGLDQLQVLAVPAPQVSVLQRMRDTHHGLARLLARGTRIVDCMAITGYQQSTISNLQADPAFQELVIHYRSATDAAEISLTERMAGVAGDAIAVLGERVREGADELTATQLVEIAKLTLDRIGYGPQKTVNNNNLSAAFSPAEMQAIRAQAPQLGGVRRLAHSTPETEIIEATATEVGDDGAPATDPGGDQVGQAAPGSSLPDPVLPLAGGQGPGAPV